VGTTYPCFAQAIADVGPNKKILPKLANTERANTLTQTFNKKTLMLLRTFFFFLKVSVQKENYQREPTVATIGDS